MRKVFFIVNCKSKNTQSTSNGYLYARIYFVELRHVCGNSGECDEGMLCAVDTNNTKSAFGNRSQNQPQVCLCNGDEGYTEDVEDNNCNGKLFFCYVIVFFSFLVFRFCY